MTRQRFRCGEHSRPTSRRPGIFPGRRFVLALTLALVSLGCSAGVALAIDPLDQTVSAQIYPAGQPVTTSTVTMAYLLANPGSCPAYSGPNNAGSYGAGGSPEAPQSFPSTSSSFGTGTWTLATVLGCLQNPVSPSQVKGVVVIGSDGAPEVSAASQLSPADLATTSDFQNTSESPVISADGDGHITYFRPWRGGTDDNFGDAVTEDDPTPFQIEVFEGPLLTVTGTASETTVPAGGTVSFSATVPGDHPGLVYSWDFDGGAPNSTEPGPQVAFDTAGRYAVTVQVTDAAGGGGEASIPITVTSATPASGKSPTGPQGSKGKVPGGSKGKHPKSGSGKSHSGKHPATGKSKSTAHSTTTAPSGGSTPTGSAPSSTGKATTSHRTATAPKHATTPVKAPPSSARNTPSHGPLVAGRLISDVTLVPAGESRLVHVVPASLATAPAVRRAISTSLLPALAAGVSVLLLFSLGAGRELRWRRGWRVLHFGS